MPKFKSFSSSKKLEIFMVTILNLKNLTAEIYPLLLLCKRIFSQLKTKNFSMVSWCFQVRSSPDISYFIFSFLFSWSSHLIHIISSWSCCVSFPPHSVILYFILVLKIKFPSFLVPEQNLNIAVIEEMPIHFRVHDQIKIFGRKKIAP